MNEVEHIIKILFIALGFIFLALGVVGIALPVLPTTPFVLVSAFCFAKSSKKLDSWLQHSRLFGPYIVNYRTKQGISVWRKVSTLVFLWTGLITSMIIVGTLRVVIALCVVGIGVTIHILMIRTKR